MKNGSYRVSFIVQLTDCSDVEEAEQALLELWGEAADEGELPEVAFEMVEEFDVEYETEEDEVKELDFS